MTTKEYRQALLLLGLIALISGARVAFAAQPVGSGEGPKEVEVEDEMSVIPSENEDVIHLPASREKSRIKLLRAFVEDNEPIIKLTLGLVFVAVMLGLAYKNPYTEETKQTKQTKPAPKHVGESPEEFAGRLQDMLEKGSPTELFYSPNETYEFRVILMKPFTDFHYTKEQKSAFLTDLMSRFEKITTQTDAAGTAFGFTSVTLQDPAVIKFEVTRH